MTVVGGPGGAEEVVAVRPAAGPLDAVVHVPGSKSLTNRALVAAALAPGRSWVRGALFADDTEAMLAALTALGITVSTDPEAGTVAVDGTGGDLGVGAASIDARMSGTTSRFVLPMLALGTGVHRLDGAPSLRARPFGHQLAALRTLGASVRELGRPGRLPVEVSGGTVRGGRLELPGDTSSQFASGLLLTAPLLDHGLELRLTGKLVSRPYLRLTVDVMTAFGATVDHDGDRTWTVAPSGYRPTGYDVEADASAASYFFAAAAVCGGRVRVQGLGRDSHQGDLAFVDVLEAMGAQVDRGATATSVIGSGELRGIDVDLADLSDTAQTLAAVAVFASGPTRVRGVGFTRAKETDRVAAVVTELRRLGIDATEHEDGFEVRPGTPRSGLVRTYGDHRMAMSFAVIGLGAPGVEICDPGCVAKTFPAFWDVLAGLDGPNTAGQDDLSAPVRVPSSMVVIAIDGPAGSGKSTVTRKLAAELDLPHLDTGAMYRAVAWAALDRGIDPSDDDAVARMTEDLHIEVSERVTVDGSDVTRAIRSPPVNATVSIVAANPAVRATLVARQRDWVAHHGGGVVEGRDIGTVVLPDAAIKVYLTARAEVRAARRHGEQPPGETLEAVAEGMAQRDLIDASRQAGPLRPAPDALQIDTSDHSVDAIVADLVGRVRRLDGGGGDGGGDGDGGGGGDGDGAGGTAERERPAIEISTRHGRVWRPSGLGFGSGEGPLALVFYRLVAALLRGVFRVWFRLSVAHRDRVPATGPFVLAPVHRSNLDTVLMAAVPRRMRFMGKDSLWKVRPAAWLLSALGGFPVNRAEADRTALERTIELLQGGEPVVLFPEGTRKSGHRVQPLFDGAVYVAARTQVPIVPVGIGGSESAMGRGSRWIRPVKVHIVVGEPIAPPALKASGRVPRRAVHQASDELREVLQELYDEARVGAGDTT